MNEDFKKKWFNKLRKMFQGISKKQEKIEKKQLGFEYSVMHLFQTAIQTQFRFDW